MEPTPVDGHAGVLDRAGFVPEFDSGFTVSRLDPGKWIPGYLPHWTTPERAAARFDLESGWLRLRIDADQPAWRPEDGEWRISGVQTGTTSGPVGSAFGPDPHRPDVTVRTAQPVLPLYTPSAGLAEAVVRAHPDPECMLAFWLSGFGGGEQSGELCVCELVGNRIGVRRSRVNIGVKAKQDPDLRDDDVEVELDLDAYDWHTYSVAWTAERAQFFVDDRLVRTVKQGISYPLTLYVALFEFPEGSARDPAGYPKRGDVAAVRGYRHALDH